MSESFCAVCSMPCQEDGQAHTGLVYTCANCGRFRLEEGAGISLRALSGAEGERLRTILSHMIWSAQDNSLPFEVNDNVIEAARKKPMLDGIEQLDLLLLFIGDSSLRGTEKGVIAKTRELRAKLCAASQCDVADLFGQAESIGFILTERNSPSPQMPTDENRIVLTIAGWRVYRELKKGHQDSKTAFMAMKFGEQPLTRIFDDYFKPAVARTGFNLETVIGKRKAGSIDDKIRVEIRNARFVVVDLTHGNQGAYFEAGFAEGLGKHVIYTCEEVAFNNGLGIHFDCRHHHTITWIARDPSVAAQELVDVVRNTLPNEAIMTDAKT